MAAFPISRILRQSAITIVAVLPALSSTHAGFQGTLELLPPDCEKTAQCQLGQDFGYLDPSGVGWQARKGLLTDGASIPPWARPFIGEPFDKPFVAAAVLHDHYCKRQVRPWRQTHKVFYEALLESNVPAVQAAIMYLGVLVGGPKWAKLVKGRPCPVGTDCINRVDVGSSVSGSQISLSSTSELMVSRANRYGSATFTNAMATGVPELMAKGNSVAAKDVEALAERMMAADFYFRNGDEIGTGVSVTVSE